MRLCWSSLSFYVGLAFPFLACIVSLSNGSSLRVPRVLGTIDGKTFVTEETTMMWREAKGYCQQYSMKLATISNQVQNDFLQSAYDESLFNSDYWTGGRDASNHRQFLWDAAETDIWTSLKLHIGIGNYLSCLTYVSRPTPDSHLSAQACSSRKKVLCEI